MKIATVQQSRIMLSVTVNPDLSVSAEKKGVMLRGDFSVTTRKITNLLAHIATLKFCDGVSDEELQDFAALPTPTSTGYYRIVVCSRHDGVLSHSSTVRSSSCVDHTAEGGLCSACRAVRLQLTRKLERARADKNAVVLSVKTPLQKIAKERLVVALKTSRNVIRQLKRDKAAIDANSFCHLGSFSEPCCPHHPARDRSVTTSW